MRQIHRAVVLCAALSLAMGAALPAAGADDHHEGYYYPPPATTETYTARVITLPESNRERRIGFVTGMTQQLLGGKYAPSYAVFAKGDEAEKLIIVTVVDNAYNTLYRMRALLAILTAVSRVTPTFKQQKVEDYYTFLDLLKMLGFERVTISDGDAFSHVIKIE